MIATGDIEQAFSRKPESLAQHVPWLFAGSTGILVPEGGGASLWSMQIAVEVCAGQDSSDWFGWGESRKEGKVIYMPTEDTFPRIKYRLWQMSALLSEEAKEKVSKNLIIDSPMAWDASLWEGRSMWVEQLERQATGRNVMILDTLRRFHVGSAADAEKLVYIMESLDGIAWRTGCSIIYIFPPSKIGGLAIPPGNDAKARAEGLSVVMDTTSWVSILQWDDTSKEMVFTINVRNNSQRSKRSIRMKKSTDSVLVFSGHLASASPAVRHDEVRRGSVSRPKQ